MTVGAVTMACLLLVSGQVGDDVYKSNHRHHKIPIVLKASQRSEIRELLLFVSTDQGKNWQQVTSVTADKDHFLYYAPTDGEYWFRVAAVTKSNEQDPKDIFRAPPDSTLKMVVDTVKPLLRIASAQRQGDELVVSWDAQDAFLDPKSLRVEYQAAEGYPPTWLPMPVTSGPRGQARVRLSSAGAISVRAEVRDQAGNTSQAQVVASPGSDITATNFQEKNSQEANTLPPAAPPVVAPPVIAPPPVKNQIELAPRGVMPPVITETPPTTTVGSSPIAAPPPAAPVMEKVVAASNEGAPPQTGLAPSLQGSRMPKLQYVNDPEILLQYKLDKVGPSGIGKVEVWMTQDGGKSWSIYADYDESPPADLKGMCKSTLELPGEGMFGLCLVVKSKAGLGKAPPRPGDAPEMLIEVDLKQPAAQLFSPVPDPERRDAVVLTWKAQDRNLTDTPVTLEWAVQEGGPWNLIAAKLPNSGRYSWPLPSNLPDKVHLRIAVRDRAGNEGIAVTNQPQTVDLSEPVGQLITVGPARQR